MITSPSTAMTTLMPSGNTAFIRLKKVEDLRYGENPHQTAVLYRLNDDQDNSWPFEQLGGKEMGYCNWLDASGAWSALQDLASDVPAVAIIKHAGPCGVAVATSHLEAYRQARACDKTSAFGGIIALNGDVTIDVVQEIVSKKHFIEVMIAPSYDPTALEILKQKKDLRILRHGYVNKTFGIRTIFGGAGILIQTLDQDTPDMDPSTWKCVTKIQPTEGQVRDLLFAMKMAKQVASNAIVFVKGERTIGIGVGQPNRARSVGFAGDQAGVNAMGAVMASDAFFPKADGLEHAINFGITAVIQPGRPEVDREKDQEIIDLANERGIAMVFTGYRHFRH